jgi:hypothetical protein
VTVSRLQVYKALRAFVETGTGKPCGLGRLPVLPDGSAVEPPYTVLQPAGAADWGPPLGNDSDTVDLGVQVTSVGGLRQDQALWMHDRAHAVLVGKDASGAFLFPLTLPGLAVMTRRLTEDVGGGDEGGIVSHVARYVVTVTGA